MHTLQTKTNRAGPNPLGGYSGIHASYLGTGLEEAEARLMINLLPSH